MGRRIKSRVEVVSEVIIGMDWMVPLLYIVVPTKVDFFSISLMTHVVLVSNS